MKTALLPVFLLAVAPHAQGKPDPHPAGALVCLQVDGPAKWQEHFAGTRMLELVRSKQFAEVFAPVQKVLDEQMADAKKEASFDVQAMHDGILAYSGRVRVVVMMDPPDAQGAGGHDEPSVVGYAAAGPDGHTDLAAACKELERIVLDGKAKHVPTSLAGREWLANAEGSVRETVPRMIGDDAVLLFYSEGSEGKTEQLFSADLAQVDAAAAAAPLRLQIDGAKFVELVLTAGSRGERQSAILQQFMSDLVGKVGKIAFHLGAVGEFVDASFDIELPGQRGSLLALLAPPRESTPELLAFVPRQHASFAAGPVDLGMIETIVKQVLDMAPDAPMDWQGLEAAVEEHAGVRLGSDVLAHLGDEYVWLGAATHDADLEASVTSMMVGAIDGLCLGLAVKDGAALARSLETILDRTGVLRMRKSEKYRDGDIHRLTIPVVSQKLYWTITDRVLVLAVGEQGLTNLQSLLDGAAMVARGDTPAQFPKELTERVAVTAPKYCSLSFQNMVGSLDTLRRLIELADGIEGDSDSRTRNAPPGAMTLLIALDLIDGFKKLLRTHRLEHVVTVTYHESDRVRQRMIW